MLDNGIIRTSDENLVVLVSFDGHGHRWRLSFMKAWPSTKAGFPWPVECKKDNGFARVSECHLSAEMQKIKKGHRGSYY